MSEVYFLMPLGGDIRVVLWNSPPLTECQGRLFVNMSLSAWRCPRRAVFCRTACPAITPAEKVKALQAAFDPSVLHFSEEYYDVPGLERPQ